MLDFILTIKNAKHTTTISPDLSLHQLVYIQQTLQQTLNDITIRIINEKEKIKDAQK